jgi:hypothetical protein
MSAITGIVVFLLFVVAAIFSAARFQQQGYVWAGQICLAVYGLCDHPYWLGVAAGMLSIVGCLHLVFDKNRTPPRD